MPTSKRLRAPRPGRLDSDPKQVVPVSTHHASILELIASRKAKVGIIGLGYVGLPLAVEFARVGFDVTGFDVDQAKTSQINAGKSYIPDVPDPELASTIAAGRLRATTDMKQLGAMDVIDICVPTPLRKTKDPDLSYIVKAVEAVAATLRLGQLIILESTTYPGTTDEVVQPMLEAKGLQADHDFFLAFSPERVDPGNAQFTTRTIPKVVGGVGKASTEAASLLYGAAVSYGRGGQLHPRGRDGQVAREHVPCGEHRARERACVDVPQDGHQRLGSDRCRPHQAVRLHAVLSRPRPRGTLHSGRSIVSVVEGEAVRLRVPVHRTGGPRQRLDAGICRPTRGRMRSTP